MRFFFAVTFVLFATAFATSTLQADEPYRRGPGDAPWFRWQRSFGPELHGPEIYGPLLEGPRNGHVPHRTAYFAHHPGDFVPHHVPLYRRVKVKDRHNIAPFAVPRVVAVRDPAICRHDCRCCEPRCVFVTVYVPPYACERVRVKKHGREVKLDYGKYEVEIEVEDGCIEIDYDD